MDKPNSVDYVAWAYYNEWLSASVKERARVKSNNCGGVTNHQQLQTVAQRSLGADDSATD